MAASMLSRLALQTARLTVVALRQQSFTAVPNRSFSVSSCALGKKWFTGRHEWIDFQDAANPSKGTVGITDYAQEQLGDLVYVELPGLDADIEKDDNVGCVESVKAASDIYSPLAGTIVEVNEKLKDKPVLVNNSPQDKGWMFKLNVSGSTDADALKSEGLMDEEAYKKFLEEC
ncbi:glycine cleavage system H protein-like [Babylonia areolata]|uniref:glycine cleavage system H protein-like n=1 Tax=Babylonia areolata TaxID=304850 RepID=UPI003FD299E8